MKFTCFCKLETRGGKLMNYLPFLKTEHPSKDPTFPWPIANPLKTVFWGKRRWGSSGSGSIGVQFNEVQSSP